MIYAVHSFLKWNTNTNKKGNEVSATLEKLLLYKTIDTKICMPPEIERMINLYLERMNEKYPRTKPLEAMVSEIDHRIYIRVVPKERTSDKDTVCSATATEVREKIWMGELRTLC